VLRELNAESALYIVDGGSTDGTPELAAELGAQVIQQKGRGYGGATRTAFEQIDAEYILTLDADFSHHPAFIRYLFAARHEAEIIIASRYASQGYADMPWTRKVLSGTLNWVFRHALDIPVRDLSSGFRLYHRRSIDRLGLQYDTYAILQEILVKAYCEGYRIREIPFHYLPRRHGTTHARLFHFGVVYLQALASMWKLRNSIDSADYDTRAFFSKIPLQRWWQRKRYKIILNFIGDKLNVLDTGCGSTQMMNGAPQMVCMDILHRKLRFMRRPGRRLVNANTFALPFKDNAFDVVLSSQVIEHIPGDPMVFRELVRCVQPGGTLIVGTPDYGRWQWPLIEKLYGWFNPSGYADEHVTHYTFDSLKARLEEAGCEVQEHAYIMKAELIVRARKKSAEE